MTQGKLSLKRLWVLMVTAFVDLIGFSLVLPLLPFYATRFGGSPFTVGILVGIFALAQMLFAPFWGWLSDHHGRRPIILAAQTLAAVAYVGFAFADSVPLLLLSRFLQGAGGGTTGVIAAYVTDTVGQDERAKALGWITACTSAGVMIGPAIASWSVGWSRAAPGLIAAGLCVLNFLFAWRWLPESAAKRTVERRSIRGDLLDILRHPTRRVSALVWIYAAGMMAFMAMNAVTALFLHARFGITERSIGIFYFAVGLVSVVWRGLILGKLIHRFGEVRVLRLGALALGIGMSIAPFATSPAQFLIVILLIPAGTAMLFPSTTSLISRYADPDHVGQTLGVQQAFGGVSRLLGPMWAGAAFQHFGEAMPYWLAGGLVLVTALFTLRLHPGERPKKEPPRKKARPDGLA
ncbi:MAG: MFS transporter [Thermoanaerobaculia bacterium]